MREVRPDRSKYKVDMILIHKKFPRIGIEVKYLRPGEGGSVLADAHKQIVNQYWDKKYLGEKIDLWAIAVYGNKFTYDNAEQGGYRARYEMKVEFAQNFFNRWGIGFLRLGEIALIEWAQGGRGELKMPAFPIESSIPMRHYEKFDPEAVLKSVRRKRGL